MVKRRSRETARSMQFLHSCSASSLFSSGDRDRANPQLAIFWKSMFGTFDIYITGHNHVLADEGDHKKTRQLISATGFTWRLTAETI